MADVFVSYKAEDRRRVRPLVAALEANGYSVWWDEQIAGGAAWRHAIESELDASKCVVVVWSKRSVSREGTFVQDEATRAQQRGVYVPVLIDKVRLPLGFGELQALPLTGWRGDPADEQFQAVLTAVSQVIVDKPLPPPRRSSRMRADRRTMIAVAGVAAVAVAGPSWFLRRRRTGSASHRIAVLPFANLSGDVHQNYFSDGIAEELRNALVRIGGLSVVGRTSSEAVRNDDAETAARKLGVDEILTGSVRQTRSNIRVSAQLVDGTSGLERWSESYDRAPGDAIIIQSDIAENVARSLTAALGSAVRDAIAVGGTLNPEAQKFLLQASEAAARRTKESYQRAISLAEAATKLDAHYAEAHARKSTYLENFADNYADNLADLAAYRSRALASATTALRLAPRLASAHRALGEYRQGVLQIAPAVGEYRRAIALSAGDAETNKLFAFLLARLARTAEALRLATTAISLDPLDPDAYRGKFIAFYYGRRFAEGVALTDEVRRKSSELFNWPAEAASASILLNRFREAEQYLAMAPENDYRRLVNESVLLMRTGKKSEISSKIDTLKRLYGDTVSYQLGQVYAQMGDLDLAFGALNRAFDIHDNGLVGLQADPLLDPLRADPRYAALVQKLSWSS